MSELPAISARELTWLALGLCVLLALFFGTTHLQRKSARRRTLQRVRQQFNGMPVQALAEKAYFHGMERMWDSRWKGYGVLLLTREMLYFRLWGRDLDITIPGNRVGEVVFDCEKGRLWLRRKRVKIVYTGADGRLRAAIWLLKKPQEWVDLIRKNLLETGFNGETAQEKCLSQNEDP